MKKMSAKSLAKAQAFHAKLDAVKSAVMAAVAPVPGAPFGHAFLWGSVEIDGKLYRACLGSVCSADLEETCRLAKTVPGVHAVTYNLD
jgi:hypothetical protein